MPGSIVVFDPLGHIKAFVQQQSPSLRQVQEIVGGYIEIVPYWREFELHGETHPCVAICDEEGKIKGRPANVRATKAWHEELAKQGLSTGGDFLVGPIAVLFGDREFMKDWSNE